jgi:hypothetical protein
MSKRFYDSALSVAVGAGIYGWPALVLVLLGLVALRCCGDDYFLLSVSRETALKNRNTLRAAKSRRIEPVRLDNGKAAIPVALVQDMLADDYWREWHDIIRIYTNNATITNVQPKQPQPTNSP